MITAVYQQVLGRDPGSAGISAWAAFYRHQGRALLVVAIASSDEAYVTAS